MIAKIILVIVYLISLLLSLIGFAGGFLLFIATFVYAFINKFQTFSPALLIVLGILAILCELIEFFSGTIGAKKFNASKQAVYGSVIGLFLGFVFSIFTLQFYLIFLGLVLGVVFGELIAGRRDFKTIGKSVIGVFLGKLGGIVLKFSLTLVMFILACWKLFF